MKAGVRFFPSIIVTLCFAISAPVSAAAPEQISLDELAKSPTINVLAWPRMQVNKLGCLFEKELDYKDRRFNCSMQHYKNKGDPCKKIKQYYEGFEFPKSKIKQIHPLLEDVRLEWEHGALQMVSMTFPKSMSKEQILKLFNIPDANTYPNNIMSIRLQDCSLTHYCLSLVGFEHMGAGDVDCDLIK